MAQLVFVLAAAVSDFFLPESSMSESLEAETQEKFLRLKNTPKMMWT